MEAAISHASHKWQDKPEIYRQCTGTSRDHDRCKRPSIPGGSVCATHGGRVPAVMAAARRRLLELVEPALGVLCRILTNEETTCQVCGRSDDMQILVKAAQLVLDRSGFGPSSKHTIERETPDLSQLDTEELAQRAERLAAVLRGSTPLTVVPTSAESLKDEDDVVVVAPQPDPDDE